MQSAASFISWWGERELSSSCQSPRMMCRNRDVRRQWGSQGSRTRLECTRLEWCQVRVVGGNAFRSMCGSFVKPTATFTQLAYKGCEGGERGGTLVIWMMWLWGVGVCYWGHAGGMPIHRHTYIDHVMDVNGGNNLGEFWAVARGIQR